MLFRLADLFASRLAPRRGPATGGLRRPTRRLRPATRHPRDSRLGLDALEPRLALAITLPIQDNSQLASQGYDVWVTGHGIPGWQPPGAPPEFLMSVASDGKYHKTANAIQLASASGTLATITTPSPHELKNGDTVFIAGTSPGPNQASYDGTYTISVTSPTQFKFTLPSETSPGNATAGTVYAPSLQHSVGVSSVKTLNVTPKPSKGPPFATAEATTSAPHGLAAGQTIQVAGVQGPTGTYAGIYNGVFTVGQVSSPTTFQYQYYFGSLPVPSSVDASTSGGTVTSAGIEPVKISTLPNKSITLDDSMTNVSSRLFFFVATANSPPQSISLNGISPADPAPPPFNPSSSAPSSVFDIVEFAYLPTGVTSTTTTATYKTTGPHGLSVDAGVNISGVAAADGKLISEYNGTFTVASVPDPMTFTVNGSYTGTQQGGGGKWVGAPAGISISPSFSTFDVSAVDGLAIPMTLTASQVKVGNVSSVGINTGSGFNRKAIGTAYDNFMNGDPLGQDFKKLLYEGAVTGTAISNVSASWLNNTATFTWTTPLVQPLVQGETVTISGFTGTAAGFNGTFTVSGTTPPTPTSFTVTNATAGLTTGTGGTVTPEVFQSPFLPAGQFNAITAPKDWLGKQATSTSPAGSVANDDPLAEFWNDTINKFFASGNTLSIYLGKESDAPIYSGSSDGTQYTLQNKKSDGTIVNSFTFPKPTPDLATGQTQSLANALYVWSQPNPGKGDQGLLQDQIWQALCRGVALDGVNPAAIDVASADSTAFIKLGEGNPQGLASIKTAGKHGLSTGASVIISGISNADYNGIHQVTKVDDTTFTFPYTFNAPAAIINQATSTFDSGTVTVTISTNGLWTAPAEGQIVYIQLTNGDPGYNGTHTVSKVDVANKTFQYTFAGSAALPAGNGGTVWGPLWSAGSRGTVDAGGSSTAWNDTSNWYTQHTSNAFPNFQSVYCPYSKFLHQSTLNGVPDTTGATSIFLHNAAYGFGEDEDPIGNPYVGPLVPSKLDGTVYDDSAVQIILAPWTGSASQPTVSSIVTIPPEQGTTPTPTIASSVQWIVTFSEPVSGVDVSAPFSNFKLIPGNGLSGTSITSITPKSAGSTSQSWTVTASTGTGTGTLGLNLVSAGLIVDASQEPLATTAYTGQVYSVRSTPVGPTATITLPDANPTSAATVHWDVTFTQPVSGLSASNFQFVPTGITGYGPAVVTPVGTAPTTTWQVAASTGTGSGTLALTLADSNNVTPKVTSLPVTSTAYTIDKVAPTAPKVSGIALADPSPTGDASVSWTVTFSEPVTGLSAANFQLKPTGLGGTPTITGVTPPSSSSTATWTVTASTGTGSGTLGIRMINSTNVEDSSSQAVTNVPFDGAVYTIDRTAPALQSIALLDANPTQLSQVQWTVRFSEPVGNVTAANFQLAPKGLTGYGPIQVSPAPGDGTVWTVTASTGSGNGTLGLTMTNSNGITDQAGLAPTGIPLVGPAYTVQRGGASIVVSPIAFFTKAGQGTRLVWPMAPFADKDSVQLQVALSASAGTFYAESKAGVNVLPSGSQSGELQFTGTVKTLNAYFRRGSIQYLPVSGSLLPQTLTLSAQGSDGLGGMATAALIVKAATAQSPPPAVNASGTLAGSFPAGKPVVITYADLVAATQATQTTARSVYFTLQGIVSGRLDYWAGSRWVQVPNVRTLPLLVPGGQLRWTPKSTATGLTSAFRVKATDGWSSSQTSLVSVNLTT